MSFNFVTWKKKFFELIHLRKDEHGPDKKLILVMAIISIFGLIMLSSASSVVAYARFGSSYHYLANQLIGLFLGIISFLIISRIDYRRWKGYAFYFLVGSILLLLLVFIPGIAAEYGSARSWINILGFSLQPSEFVKLSFLFYLAAWLESRSKERDTDEHHGIWQFLIILGIIAFLVIKQPDAGTLFIISLVSLIVYFVGGAPFRNILFIVLAGALALIVMVSLKPYQADRFKCLKDPTFDSEKTCYQINQSLIAVGSGGVLGRGLGQSRQKFMYLPEVWGDSVFSVIGEELGFVFCVILMLLFLYLFYRGYLIAKKAPDVFGKILAIGISSWIMIQAFLNIGGMINLVPMTGVPLPFVSYGGSAILAVFTAMGVLVNISRQTRN
ncbi:MAG: putative lipid II flippase FtsW [Planctomycetes bacterium]|jgi:cell division protein FtsW|nr:putative lipid II flippase FtsW [Planctomycetota bacterium]